MSYTSTQVKARYNAKTYTRFACDLRNEEFERIEAMRGDLSRAAFLKALVSFWESHGAPPLTPSENEKSE